MPMPKSCHRQVDRRGRQRCDDLRFLIGPQAPPTFDLQAIDFSGSVRAQRRTTHVAIIDPWKSGRVKLAGRQGQPKSVFRILFNLCRRFLIPSDSAGCRTARSSSVFFCFRRFTIFSQPMTLETTLDRAGHVDLPIRGKPVDLRVFGMILTQTPVVSR